MQICSGHGCSSLCLSSDGRGFAKKNLLVAAAELGRVAGHRGQRCTCLKRNACKLVRICMVFYRSSVAVLPRLQSFVGLEFATCFSCHRLYCADSECFEGIAMAATTIVDLNRQDA